MKYAKEVRDDSIYLSTHNYIGRQELIHSYNNKPCFICVSFSNKTIVKYWKNNGVYHNLTGPAFLVYNFNNKKPRGENYYINGILYPKEKWEKHPEVIKYKIKQLINN